MPKAPAARRSGILRRGFTLIEIMIAMSIATVASMALMSIFVMVARFVQQGFTETRHRFETSIALEEMTRTLNHAYTMAAQVASYRPVIAADSKSVTFSVPAEGGGADRFRYRYNAGAKRIEYEQMGGGGGFASVNTRPFLTQVRDFFVVNQQGIFSLVITVEQDLGRNGLKRFTMVGRALPRNL